ncbi:uncharacterized protein LOC125308360 isoform X2 [Alosa alosa]|uniref:uncharacterized protein LOC125308360 isoform X2 n=1 Tax=Alosa alosa TaxID=278164 RepID=UPI0020154946|nr:uncharacterized protein LOC125308360 isoform X2 [Alosa alosa]
METSTEVSWGQSAQMSCSISTQHQGGTFTLQQLSGSFTETKRDTWGSALFPIPQVDFIHEGDYYCQYQTRVSSREFTSPQSATVSLSVVASQTPIIASGVILGLFLLLLIPAILYLVKNKCDTHTHTIQMNTVAHSGSPDEDENIYVNTVMPADQRNHDKEDDGDLEDDYVNAEELHGPTATDNDITADQWDCGKEADGDLEEDYVNVEELHGPAAIDND